MERFIEAYDANLFGPLRVAKAVIPHMAARKTGTIINIGSVMGETYGLPPSLFDELALILQLQSDPMERRVCQLES